MQNYRRELNDALRRICDEGDQAVAIRVGNFNYTSTGFKAQVICEEVNGVTGVAKKHESDWNYAVKLGHVRNEWLGQVITDKRGTWKVVGYDMNKPKNCIAIQNTKNDKLYCTSLKWLEMSIRSIGLQQTRRMIQQEGSK